MSLTVTVTSSSPPPTVTTGKEKGVQEEERKGVKDAKGGPCYGDFFWDPCPPPPLPSSPTIPPQIGITF